MERRNFLRGAIAGLAGTGLIVAANATEVAAFTKALPPGAPIMLEPEVLPPAQFGRHRIQHEFGYLYNARGERVVLVTDLEYSTPVYDVATFSNPRANYVRGHGEAHVRGLVVGCVVSDPFELRGFRGGR